MANLNKKVVLYSIIILLLFPLIILFSKEITIVFFVAGFIIINILISSYKKNFQFPIELEILTMGIVLSTFAFGLKAGMLIAIFGTILSSAFYGYYSPFLIPMVMGNAIICVLTPLFPMSHIFITGVILSLIKNIFIFLFYHFIFNYDIGKNISYGVSNIILNAILFFNIAPLLFGIMN